MIPARPGATPSPARPVRVTGLAVVVLLAACAGRKADKPPEAPEAPEPPVAPPPAGHPLAARSWTAPATPVIAPFPGTTGISAASCGTCHQEIYQEWAASTHAHAWVDRQFQAELHKDEDVAWLCINCHTPLGNQQAELTAATTDVRAPIRSPNADFDPALQQEGITCLSCHWRPEGIAAVHADAVAPHPLVHAPELRSETTCTGCHQAVARLEDALVCTFNTGQEWAEADPGKTCPACHMPPVTRASAPGAPPRAGGRHAWPGSLIPKDQWSADEAAVFADWAPGVALDFAPPEAAVVGETVALEVVLRNARAGHMLPTGDPERYLELVIQARDAAGAVQAETTARIGQQWEWWPTARKLSDNRLAPGEARPVALSVVMPAGGLEIDVALDHVRISPENAGYHDLGDYPTRRRVVDRHARIRPGTAPTGSAP